MTSDFWVLHCHKSAPDVLPANVHCPLLLESNTFHVSSSIQEAELGYSLLTDGPRNETIQRLARTLE